jgi:hypothetical protein
MAGRRGCISWYRSLLSGLCACQETLGQETLGLEAYSTRTRHFSCRMFALQVEGAGVPLPGLCMC